MLAALSQQYKVIGCFAGGRDKRRQGRKGGEQRRIGYGRGLIGTSIIYPPPKKKILYSGATYDTDNRVVCSVAEKVTIDLVFHWPCVTLSDIPVYDAKTYQRREMMACLPLHLVMSQSSSGHEWG